MVFTKKIQEGSHVRRWVIWLLQCRSPSSGWRGGSTGGTVRGVVGSARGGACGVMSIIVGNGHGDTSSNPRRDWLHFT